MGGDFADADSVLCGRRANVWLHQERPICLPVSLSGLHWAASNSCQDCPWSWLRPAKTISKDLNEDFGAQRLNGSYIKTYYEAR